MSMTCQQSVGRRARGGGIWKATQRYGTQKRRRTIRTDECPDGLAWIRGWGEGRIVLYPERVSGPRTKDSHHDVAASKRRGHEQAEEKKGGR